MKYKLGKLPPREDNRTLLFANYRTHVALPPVPATYGHAKLVLDFGMLANDRLGDCAIASAMHQIIYWNACCQKVVRFTNENAIATYSAVTGYNPDDPNSDQGTVMIDLLNYWRNTGITDADGNVHKLGAYVKLQAGNATQVNEAAYLFGGASLGVQMPSSTQAEFDENRPWQVTAAQIEGGHAIPLIQRDANLEIVTWGRLQGMTKGFYRHYCDEAYALLSEEFVAGGKTIEGFDLAALQADLKAIGA